MPSINTISLYVNFTISSFVHVQEFWILRMMILSCLTLGILWNWRMQLTYLDRENTNICHLILWNQKFQVEMESLICAKVQLGIVPFSQVKVWSHMLKRPIFLSVYQCYLVYIFQVTDLYHNYSTCSGVLDPEELFMINKGFKKAKTRLLPGIKEELQRSAESNSTIDSDRFSLESLEIDLFEDIRASIQKSSKESNLAISSHQMGLGVGLQSICFKYTGFSVLERGTFPAFLFV